jgi:hypothetical protein
LGSERKEEQCYHQVRFLNIPNEECDGHPFIFSWDQNGKNNNANHQVRFVNIPIGECEEHSFMFSWDLNGKKNNANLK